MKKNEIKAPHLSDDWDSLDNGSRERALRRVKNFNFQELQTDWLRLYAYGRRMERESGKHWQEKVNSQHDLDKAQQALADAKTAAAQWSDRAIDLENALTVARAELLKLKTQIARLLVGELD